MGGHNKLNLVGDKYNSLSVVDFSHSDKHGQRWYKCVCDCGNELVAKGARLRNGNTKSCGCLRVEKGRLAGLSSVIHGMIHSPVYNSWRSMKKRCLDETDESYKWYGAKGVTVCEKWMTFEGFYEDMGDRPDEMTLDRINPFGNYEPSNCRWADMKTQNNNQRRHYEGAVCQS